MTRNWIVAALLSVAFVSAASAQIAVQPSPPPPAQPCGGLHPIMATHTIPPYPDLSRRLNEQGAVVLLVAMSQQGVPTDVTVNRSSGSARLDNAAQSWVQQTWRWAPLDSSCSGGARTMVKITFVLQNPEGQDSDEAMGGTPIAQFAIPARKAEFPAGAWDRNERGDVYLAFTINDRGGLEGLRIVKSSGNADLDAQAMTLVRRHKFQGPRMDGKPTLQRLVVVVGFGAPAIAMPPPPPPQ